MKFLIFILFCVYAIVESAEKGKGLWGVFISIVLFFSIYFVYYFFNKEKIKAKIQEDELKKSDDINNQLKLEKLFNEMKVSKVFERKDKKLFLGYKEESKEIIIMSRDEDKIISRIIPYKDILGVEILADDKSIEKAQRESQIGATLMGGVLFGMAGAFLAGALSSKSVYKLELVLMVNDINKPIEKIMFSDEKVDLDNEILKIIKEWYSIVNILIKKADKEDYELEVEKFSLSEELLKLNDLKEKGILTGEEFQTQKLRLLA